MSADDFARLSNALTLAKKLDGQLVYMDSSEKKVYVVTEVDNSQLEKRIEDFRVVLKLRSLYSVRKQYPDGEQL